MLRLAVSLKTHCRTNLLDVTGKRSAEHAKDEFRRRRDFYLSWIFKIDQFVEELHGHGGTKITFSGLRTDGLTGYLVFRRFEIRQKRPDEIKALTDEELMNKEEERWDKFRGEIQVHGNGLF